MPKLKVVINRCFGGFGLSQKAAERLAQLGVASAQEALDDNEKHPSVFGFCFSPSKSELARHDPRLVQVVEELGDEANGNFAELRVYKLQGSRYIIDEYDGSEGIQEPKDINWIVAE